jgi:hypothetical protein
MEKYLVSTRPLFPIGGEGIKERAVTIFDDYT